MAFLVSPEGGHEQPSRRTGKEADAAGVKSNMVKDSLNNTPCAADAAREKAARSLAAIMLLMGDIRTVANCAPDQDGENVYLYRAGGESGTLALWRRGMDLGAPCGQCPEHGHLGMWLWVRVLEHGVVSLSWSKGPDGPGGFAWDQNLCGG